MTTVESEILTPAGRRWIERAQLPLDVLAVIFLIDVILIWSFPDATADSQAPLLDRLDELAARQDEIRAMLIELRRPPTRS